MSVFNKKSEFFVIIFSGIFFINAMASLKRLKYICSYVVIHFFYIRFEIPLGKMPNTKRDLLYA